jgi:hypothetical protein
LSAMGLTRHSFVLCRKCASVDLKGDLKKFLSLSLSLSLSNGIPLFTLCSSSIVHLLSNMETIRSKEGPRVLHIRLPMLQANKRSNPRDRVLWQGNQEDREFGTK